MSSFQDLLTRVSILTEAKVSPYTASHPSFGGITSKMKAGGLSSAPLDTIKFIREVLYFLDIIDDGELNAIKNGAGFTGKKQAMLNVLKQKQELINAKSDEIAARISDTLDDFIGGVGVNRGREEKYAARAVAQEMAKQVRQTRTGKEMDDALTDLIADDSLIVRASVAKILSEIQTNLGEPGFDIDDTALAEVMDFAPKINSVEKLKSFVKQIGSLPGYEKIAAYLSAAVKPIVQGKEDEEMVEDEETDPESYYDPSGRAGVGEKEYDEVMGSKEEEAEDGYDDDYGQELHAARIAREKGMRPGPVNPWEAEYEAEPDFTDDFDGAFEFMDNKASQGEFADEKEAIAYMQHIMGRDLTPEESAQVDELYIGQDIGGEDEEFNPKKADLNKSGKVEPWEKAIAKKRGFTNSEVVGESYTATYMSEQVVYSTPKPITESVSFKQKFAPKTSFQLEELRRYGL